MPADVLAQRALNRATLARQFLLERTTLAPLDVVTHVVGLQAQEPLDPYLGLWSRVEGFRPEDLARLLEDREVVRIVALRATIHLVTADDCLLLRPLSQPVLDQELTRHRDFSPHLRDRDLSAVLAYARTLLSARAYSMGALRAALQERFPDEHAPALAYACRNLIACVQPPPRGVWGRVGQVTLTAAEAYLGRPLVDNPSVDDVVLRYLGAFGPATPADAATWSRLTGFREVFERLRPRLRVLRDERGRELFDLPDAPRPDPESPAPPRFLPTYDNVVLSHADRSRFFSDDFGEPAAVPRPLNFGSVLVDGVVGAIWWLQRDRSRATLVLAPHTRLPKRDQRAMEAEARRVVAFLAADADREVRVAA